MRTQICSAPFFYVTCFLALHIFRQGFLLGTVGPQVYFYFYFYYIFAPGASSSAPSVPRCLHFILLSGKGLPENLKIIFNRFFLYYYLQHVEFFSAGPISGESDQLFRFFFNPEQVEFFFGEHPSNSTVHNVTSEKSTVAENLTNSFNIILPLGYFYFFYTEIRPLRRI